MSEITQILTEIEAGQEGATERLLPLVYDQLRRLARRQMTLENDTQTLDPTGLVHEAYLRLIGKPGQETLTWNSRGHFLAAAAEAMRRILVESARRKRSLKAGGRRRKLPLTGNEAGTQPQSDSWLVIDQAMSDLALVDPLAARVSELRLFTGLSIDDVAEALEISRATAFRHWAYARARLRMAMGEADDRLASASPIGDDEFIY